MSKSNYHYIITGLPNLILDFQDGKPLSYQELRNEIAALCSPEDLRLIEWLELGFDEENLSHHTYRAVAKSKNRFLREYYDFDRIVRNLTALKVGADTGIDGSKYTIGDVPAEYPDKQRIMSILNLEDLLEKERMLDKLRWDKANEINTFHYFDMDVLLAFILKLKIVDRWNSLNKEKGAEMFQTLVDEVLGTYKGIDKENL